MTKLKLHRSLSGQAEFINKDETYRELIDTIKGMTYKELYDLMRDAETVLKVLVRGEEESKDTVGLETLAERIELLAHGFLVRRRGVEPWPSSLTKYTYEL